MHKILRKHQLKIVNYIIISQMTKILITVSLTTQMPHFGRKSGLMERRFTI